MHLLGRSALRDRIDLDREIQAEIDELEQGVVREFIRPIAGIEKLNDQRRCSSCGIHGLEKPPAGRQQVEKLVNRTAEPLAIQGSLN